MKNHLYAIDDAGKVVAVVIVDGDTVKIESVVNALSALNGKTLNKRVGFKGKGIVGDGFVPVEPGAPGYVDAVIDTIEGMGYAIVS